MTDDDTRSRMKLEIVREAETVAAPAAGNAAAAQGDADAGGGADRKPSASAKMVASALDTHRPARRADGQRCLIPTAQDGPTIAIPLGEAAGLLRSRWWAEYKSAPKSSEIADALGVLEALADQNAPEPIAVRCASTTDGQAEGNTQQRAEIDRGLPDGSCYVIEGGRWSIGQPRTIFARPRRAGAMAEADASAGPDSWEKLGGYVHAADRTDLALVAAWAAFAMARPDAPCPILLMAGQQGSGKTTGARAIKRLIDPGQPESGRMPRDPTDLVLKAAQLRALVVDNISRVSDDASDTLCTLVTGETIATRRLYSNDELFVAEARAAVIATAIATPAIRGDLSDRMLALELVAFDAGDDGARRKSERQLWADFDKERGAILAGLLDLAADGLAAGPEGESELARRESQPRMHDFSGFLAAIDHARDLGLLDRYLQQDASKAAAVIESSAVAASLLRALHEHSDLSPLPPGLDEHQLEHTAGEILGLLAAPVPTPTSWPRTARAISGELRRLAPALAQLGVELRTPEQAGRSRDTHRHRTFRITWKPDAEALELAAEGGA